MVENRRLLIALAVVLVVGIGARFGLTRVELDDGIYYTDAPNETRSFEALETYVCPKCVAAIYEAFEKRAHDPEARHVVETYRLRYSEPPENGCCPNHPEQPLLRTPEFPVDPGAKVGLPPDTDFICRVYRPKNAPAQSHEQVNLMIVISSRNKRSIHRPESCMAAQGWTLVAQQTLHLRCKRVPGGMLSVRSLLMEKPGGKDRQGNRIRYQSVVFYWYAALPDRLTSSEYRRLATMFYDRLVRGSNFRWSYVLITKLVQPGESPADVSKELERFVAEFTEAVETGADADRATGKRANQ
jgi:hypothetical protein